MTRPVRQIHQIEVTSRCDLRCPYCPSRDIVAGKHPDRGAVDMTREHFLRALEWVKHYVRAGTQGELNLSGIGESVLHPEFPEFLRLAREAIGPERTLLFPTNGVRLGGPEGEALVKAIAPARPRVYVSLHRPEKAGPAIERLKAAGIFAGATCDPATGANDWAGQVEWTKPTYRMRCPWMLDGWAFVYADGRIGHCCIDASGAGAIGHVSDAPGSLALTGYALCGTCYQEWGQSRAPRASLSV